MFAMRTAMPAFILMMRCKNILRCYFSQKCMRLYRSAGEKYVLFGLGKLPDYAVHPDAASILCKLDSVFRQLGRGVDPVIRVGGHCLWDIGNIGNNADGKNKHGQWQQPSRAL